MHRSLREVGEWVYLLDIGVAIRQVGETTAKKRIHLRNLRDHTSSLESSNLARNRLLLSQQLLLPITCANEVLQLLNLLRLS